MRILIPLPVCDFDPTEAAVPWRILNDAGHEVVFATPAGQAATADERMLSGRGLGPWRRILRASERAIDCYRALCEDPHFKAPLGYEKLASLDVAAIVLPGGHAPGMIPYLESSEVQQAVRQHLAANKPLGAICHGVLVLARTLEPASGRSVLHGRRTTALLKSMEMSAWLMTAGWLGDYYRTYPETVEDEVKRALASPNDFSTGPMALLRDKPSNLERGFTVRDGNYLSARWPGDAYRFASELLQLL